MSIAPRCDSCGKELIEFGAILLGPPDGNLVEKFHPCQDCYKKIRKNYINKVTSDEI